MINNKKHRSVSKKKHKQTKKQTCYLLQQIRKQTGYHQINKTLQTKYLHTQHGTQKLHFFKTLQFCINPFLHIPNQVSMVQSKPNKQQTNNKQTNKNKMSVQTQTIETKHTKTNTK